MDAVLTPQTAREVTSARLCSIWSSLQFICQLVSYTSPGHGDLVLTGYLLGPAIITLCTWSTPSLSGRNKLGWNVSRIPCRPCAVQAAASTAHRQQMGCAHCVTRRRWRRSSSHPTRRLAAQAAAVQAPTVQTCRAASTQPSPPSRSLCRPPQPPTSWRIVQMVKELLEEEAAVPRVQWAVATSTTVLMGKTLTKRERRRRTAVQSAGRRLA